MSRASENVQGDSASDGIPPSAAGTSSQTTL